MSFENSPRLGEPVSARLPFSSWVHKNRRFIIPLAVVVVFLSIVVFIFQILSVFQQSVPGALEGCLVTASGDPLVTTVHIGAISRPTYPDGCFFFFPNISPGKRELIISMPSGEVSIPVEILSDQANSLGTIIVNP
jgi:hypothetical protein